MEASRIEKQALRSGNLILEKAYPAMAEVSICDTVSPTEKTALALSPLRIFTLPHTSA